MPATRSTRPAIEVPTATPTCAPVDRLLAFEFGGVLAVGPLVVCLVPVLRHQSVHGVQLSSHLAIKPFVPEKSAQGWLGGEKVARRGKALRCGGAIQRRHYGRRLGTVLKTYIG